MGVGPRLFYSPAPFYRQQGHTIPTLRLYRSLLRRLRQAEVDKERRGLWHDTIQKRFRKHQRLNDTGKTKRLLKAAYAGQNLLEQKRYEEFHALLQPVDKESRKPSLEQIPRLSTFVDSVKEDASSKTETIVTKTETIVTDTNGVIDGRSSSTHRKAKPDRVVIAAPFIPFIRRGSWKCQPVRLSMMIHHRIGLIQKRLDQEKQLEALIQQSREENLWSQTAGEHVDWTEDARRELAAVRATQQAFGKRMVQLKKTLEQQVEESNQKTGIP